MPSILRAHRFRDYFRRSWALEAPHTPQLINAPIISCCALPEEASYQGTPQQNADLSIPLDDNIPILVKPRSAGPWQYLGYLGDSDDQQRGRVCLVACKHSHAKYAVKIVNLRGKSRDAANTAELVAAEVHVLNCITPSSFLLRAPTSTIASSTVWRSSKGLAHIISEYCPGGNLSRFSGSLTDNTLRRIFAELLLGLEHLHAFGIIHSDLQARNVLISSEGHCKITSFEFCGCDATPVGLGTSRDGQRYETPELSNRASRSATYHCSMDIWGLATTMYDLAINWVYRDFRRASVAVRPRLEELHDHRFIDLLELMRQTRPDRRITLQQAKQHKYFGADPNERAIFWWGIERMEKPLFSQVEQRPVELAFPLRLPGYVPPASNTPQVTDTLIYGALAKRGCQNIAVPLMDSFAPCEPRTY